MLSARDLNQRVRFERLLPAVDAVYGTTSNTWESVATVWAQVQDVLPNPISQESSTHGIDLARHPSRIRIRYRTDITSAMRIVLLGRGDAILQIIGGPSELGRRQGLEIMAEHFSTQG